MQTPISSHVGGIPRRAQGATQCGAWAGAHRNQPWSGRGSRQHPAELSRGRGTALACWAGYAPAWTPFHSAEIADSVWGRLGDSTSPHDCCGTEMASGLLYVCDTEENSASERASLATESPFPRGNVLHLVSQSETRPDLGSIGNVKRHFGITYIKLKTAWVGLTGICWGKNPISKIQSNML